MVHRSLLMIGVLGISGCSNSGIDWTTSWSDTWRDSASWDTGPTGTTPPTTPPPQSSVEVDTVSGGCDPKIGTFVYQVLTTGWAEGIVLHLYRAEDARMESHPMDLIDLDPGGAWDLWRTGLVPQETGPYSAEETTSFVCGESLAQGVRLEGADGRTRDCVVWGDAGVDALAAALRRIDPGVDAIGGCRLL